MRSRPRGSAPRSTSTGDHAGAQTVLRQALKVNPGDPLLSVNLGLSLILGGNPREGANVLLDVTRYPAAPPQARQNLALAYGLLGNTEAAAEILSHDHAQGFGARQPALLRTQRARIAQPATSAAPLPMPATAARVGLAPAAQIQAASLR